MFKKWKKDNILLILWLYGIPGSGKSKLILVEYNNTKRSLLITFTKSIIIKDILKDFNFDYSFFLTYFYCSQNPAKPIHLKSEAIFASIIK